MIYLIAMPFSSIGYPSLGLPLISSILKAGGLSVRTFYLNLILADIIGIENYETIAAGRHTKSCVAEWLFAGEMWGDAGEKADRDFLEYAGFAFDSRVSQLLLRLKRDAIPLFYERCMKRLDISQAVEVVGFSCLFHVLPSLLLGRMIKEAYPKIRVIYGGSGFHGSVGAELFDKLEWIDAMSNSEADDVALEAFKRLKDGRPLEGLQGMMHRDRTSGKIYKTEGAPVSWEAFDNGLHPDFEDYFRELSENNCLERIGGNMMFLPYESSRGCWWHDQSPCRFCGLNGVSSVYRAKKPENVIATLKNYHALYNRSFFGATDNNLSMTYFESFLPKLRALNESDSSIAPENSYNIFYCVRSSLNRAEIKRLAESGVFMAQPGIESLSDNLLKQMNKGVFAIQNIYFLKCARQYGVFAAWYILMRMPGERQEDYDEMRTLVPKIVHLTPPGSLRAFIDCHRYSEYYKESEHYFEYMKPAKSYSMIYPDFFDLDKIAYTFDVKWRGLDESTDYEALTERLKRWQTIWCATDLPALYIREEPDSRLSLIDSRGGDKVVVSLDEKETGIYGMLDDIVSEREILEGAADFCDMRETLGILDSFVEYGFAVRYGNNYLGLANRNGFKVWSQDERRKLMRDFA
ncbi:RiPP maturation radical SAM protein 1 [Synergistales bacterium]|nr:RiPP maturation radical SAM protein 1 [Synergistales bacterium]